MITHPKLIKVEDYAPFIGDEAVERILKKAKPLQNASICNVNSTLYGGGVAELLLSMSLLMSATGVKAEWQRTHGYPEFFDVTKAFHNALQSGDFNLTAEIKDIYEKTQYENSVRMRLDHDLVVIHDPQPLGMIQHYKKNGPWIWRCHIDMSNPHTELWNWLKPHVNKYDAAIFSIKEYTQELDIPQHLFMPATDPFSKKNRELSEDVMEATLKKYDIPTDLPIICQVSRFDKWKDPEGVIQAYKKAREEVDCTLVMLGNSASDDPEGSAVFESLLKHRDDRTLIMACGDDIDLVNSLQKKSAVVLQKSIREGFGLTVTEAMWKGTPVIGGNVGGIRYQIQDGENGFLVNSPDEAAQRIVELLKDEKKREEMGRKAKESVANNFLLTRLMEQYLDLFQSLLTAKKKEVLAV